MHLSDAHIKSLLAKIDRRGPDECWEWTAALHDHGYGMIGVGGRRGKVERAHRVVFFLHNGFLTPGLFVCHHCDNRKCCNPSHLFEGTAADNHADMMRKGRNSLPPRNDFVPTAPRGEAQHAAKMTAADVVELRNRRSLGETYQSLSNRFGICIAQAQAIAKRRSWKHVA